MELRIDLAGTVLRIVGADEEMFSDPGILKPFVTDAAQWDREVLCRITETLPEPVGECAYHNSSRWVYHDADAVISYLGTVLEGPEQAHIRTLRREGSTEVLVRRGALMGHITVKTVLHALEAEHLIAQNRGVLFHSSYIGFDGGAILFTASSGVGKSTQAELWRSLRGAEVINGDRSVIRMGQEGPEAWGVPFCGSSGISRHSCLPLRAIVCLSQAPKTTIRPLTGARAFRQVWEGCSLHTWDREDVSVCSETVMQIVSRTPVFHLACTPDESAVTALESALKQRMR